MHFDTSPEYDQQYTPLKQPYFIVSAPRSGSTLLGQALAAQGLGIPLEYYNFENNPAISEFYLRLMGLTEANPDTVISIPEYTAELFRKRTTPNGIFGCKFFSHHHQRWFGNQFSQEQQLFPKIKYIWLRRKDLVRRAISYYFAQQTRQWNSSQPAARTMSEVQYDFAQILDIFRAVKEYTQYWPAYFQAHPEVDLYTLYYNDLVTDYENSIRKVNHFLGVSGLEIPEQPISKQESSLKEEYKQRFIQDIRRHRVTR